MTPAVMSPDMTTDSDVIHGIIIPGNVSEIDSGKPVSGPMYVTQPRRAVRRCRMKENEHGSRLCSGYQNRGGVLDITK
jgi:hypothetical protein